MNITKEQFKDLEHLAEMFNHNAEEIRNLCSTEKSDINYGFELGQMYKHLKECYHNMNNIISEFPLSEEETFTKDVILRKYDTYLNIPSESDFCKKDISEELENYIDWLDTHK